MDGTSNLASSYTSAPREFSPMRSPNDSQSPDHSWKMMKQYSEQINSLTQTVNTLTQEIQRLKGRTFSSLDMHPYKIYCMPRDFLPTSSIDDWRSVTVRNGLNLTKTTDTGSNFLSGSDEIKYTYNDFLPDPITKGRIQVPISCSAYWLWQHEVTGSTTSSYRLYHSTTPTVAGTYNQYAWTTFPSADTLNIPIGYVDTLSSGSINKLYIRQFLHADIQSAGGQNGNYITMSVCINRVQKNYAFMAYPV